MPVNIRKMADLKDEILSKINDTFSEVKLEILSALKQELKIKNWSCRSIQKWIEKREEIESTVSVRQQHVKIGQNQIKEIQQINEELEQYGRRCTINQFTSTMKELFLMVRSLLGSWSYFVSNIH